MSAASAASPGKGIALLLPLWALYGLFLAAPIFSVLLISFATPGDYGGVVWKFSPDSYVNLLFQKDFDDSLQFDSSFLLVLSRSVMMSALTTVTTFVLGFPTAYFIARQPASRRNLLMLLIVIPFWSSLLTRIYAWIIILGSDGIVERLVRSFVPGFTMNFMFSPSATLLGMTYTYLPIMILPIYASLEKLDFRLIQASRDLYATGFQTMRLVVMPLAAKGILAGITLVLIPSLGDVVVPTIMGGGRFMMLGNYVVQQFGEARNWPYGATIGVTILVAVALVGSASVRLSQALRQSRLEA